jgi:hypothetical protein
MGQMGACCCGCADPCCVGRVEIEWGIVDPGGQSGVVSSMSGSYAWDVVDPPRTYNYVTTIDGELETVCVFEYDAPVLLDCDFPYNIKMSVVKRDIVANFVSQNCLPGPQIADTAFIFSGSERWACIWYITGMFLRVERYGTKVRMNIVSNAFFYWHKYAKPGSTFRTFYRLRGYGILCGDETTGTYTDEFSSAHCMPPTTFWPHCPSVVRSEFNRPAWGAVQTFFGINTDITEWADSCDSARIFSDTDSYSSAMASCALPNDYPSSVSGEAPCFPGCFTGTTNFGLVVDTITNWTVRHDVEVICN